MEALLVDVSRGDYLRSSGSPSLGPLRRLINSMNDLTGMKVLVTNVKVGPGPAIVAELARRGAAVAVQHAYNNDRSANETTAKISVLTGRKPAIIRTDLRHVSECDQAVEEAAETLDGLDVLVNNAGVVPPRDFLDTDEAVYRLPRP